MREYQFYLKSTDFWEMILFAPSLLSTRSRTAQTPNPRPGDEGFVSGAGQHDAADVLIVIEVRCGLDQTSHYGRIDCIQRLGPVDRDDPDPALYFRFNHFAHSSLSLILRDI